MQITGLRWYIVSLVALSTIINFIDRSAINIMWPYIYKDFHISDTESKNALAVITSFFLIAYALGQVCFGTIMDKIGTRLGMSLAIAFWSVSIALHSFARSLFSFNIFRSMLGFSEAGNWPGAVKTNAEWFPRRERAIAQGIFGASTAIGSIIAGPIIALLYLKFGWRLTFIAIGSLGLLWIIPWLFIYKSGPREHPWVASSEKDHIDSGHNVSTGPVTTSEITGVYSFKELLAQRNTWGILLARFFIDPVWWLFITWLPTFLKERFLFDIKQIAAFSWCPYLLAAIGGISGGLYSLKRMNHGCSTIRARKEAITIGCVIMFLFLSVMAVYIDSPGNPDLIMIFIGMALFGFQFLINNLQTLASDYYRGGNVGTIAGMGGTAAVAGTLITTGLVPVITVKSYIAFFALGCLLVPLSWVSVVFINSDQNYHNNDLYGK